MSSIWPDLSTKVTPELNSMDHFDRLPDSILLVILNNVADVKSLGRCSAINRRFCYLIPQVQSVILKVDCVVPECPPSKGTPPLSFIKTLITSLFKLLIRNNTSNYQQLHHHDHDDHDHDHDDLVTHHSPKQVLRNFHDIRNLKIELPTGELGIEQGVLLRWKADFGSTLENCVILGASSVHSNDVESSSIEDNGSIPESFYTNGGLKLRVVWTISSLIAASARHYLLQPIISSHKTVKNLVVTDVDGQGVLTMNKEQLEELRVKPLSASSASKRTLVPALNMRLWYAPVLELGDGRVLKGATLVAIRPSDKKDVADGEWVASAFDEPFGGAARMLLKRRKRKLRGVKSYHIMRLQEDKRLYACMI